MAAPEASFFPKMMNEPRFGAVFSFSNPSPARQVNAAVNMGSESNHNYARN
jgi:hypothetical protein